MFTFPPTLNRSSPQMNGLRYCWPFFGYPGRLGIELGRGAHATLTTGIPAIAGPQNPILTPATNGTSHVISAPITVGDVNTLTLSFWLYWNTNTTGYSMALEYTTDFGAGNGFVICPNWDPNQWEIGVGNGTNYSGSYITPRPSAAVWHHFVVLMDRTATPAGKIAYMDGVNMTLGNDVNNATPGNFAGPSTLYILNRAGASLFGAGRICDLRIYAGKLLSAAEVEALYDPRSRWELYLPEERRVWAIPASAPVRARTGRFRAFRSWAVIQKIFTLCFFLLSVSTAHAVTRYVAATGGSDSNPGTEVSPYATIQKAADVVNAGDIVIVEDGTYIDNDANDIIGYLTRGGTAGNVITFKARNKWGAKLNGQSNATKHGWHVDANYIVIQDFEMYNLGDTGGDGFDINANNITITGNWVHDIGRACSDSTAGYTGIFTENTRSDITITGNVFNNIGRFSPGESGCSPAQPYYQNLDHGIYADGNPNLTIANNIFYNNGHGWGIQIYPNATSNLKILNNTFAFPNTYRPGHIILAAPITTAVIANNIFYSPTTAGVRWSSGTQAGVVINNNITYGGVILTNETANPNPTLTANSDNTNPLLVNAAGLNFQLQAGSPARDAGVTRSESTPDFDGNPRPYGVAYDIGAYEYVSGFTPVAPSNLTTGGDGACNATAPTASFTPTANALVLACVVQEAATAGTATMSGNGLTWVEVATVLGSGSGIRTTLFRASGASPTTGAATITVSGDQTNCTWAIAQFTGQDTSGTNGSGAIVQSATNFASSTTSLAVNLGAFSNTNNATFGCFGISNNTTFTPGSGFTEVGTHATGFGSKAMNEFRADNATTVDVTFGTSVPAGIAVEIKQAAAAAAGRRRSG